MVAKAVAVLQKDLPEPVRVLSQWLPVTHSLTGMRLAILGGNGPALNREIEILLLFGLTLVPASVGFFSWTVSRARRLGTLSFYRLTNLEITFVSKAPCYYRSRRV
jgi:hypothetical protein